MKKFLLLAIVLFACATMATAQEANVRATLYYPGGSVGTGTSSGKRISMSKVLSGEHRWVALPPRLRKELGLSFGDTIVVTGSDTPWVNGLWSVEDHMSNRLHYNIDFLVHRSKAREFRQGRVNIRKKRTDERIAVVGGELLEDEIDTAESEELEETASVAPKETVKMSDSELTQQRSGDCALMKQDGDNDSSETPEMPARKDNSGVVGSQMTLQEEE